MRVQDRLATAIRIRDRDSGVMPKY